MKQYTAEELNALDKEALVALLMQTQRQNFLFMEQIASMQAQRFGRKTEKLGCLDQISFFNEVEAEAEKESEENLDAEPETEEISYTRKKKAPGKLDEMLAGLPHRIEKHELSEDELVEIFGENGWKQLPDDVYTNLEYIPSSRKAVEHHVAVYAAKKKDMIVRAPHPAELLKHSIATPSLVAAIMNAKYTNAVPLYRIRQEFERNDVKLSGPTMANWVIRCSERYLYPVTERLRQELCKLQVVQADETVCKVSKDGRPANAESRMFVYRSSELEKEKAIILFDYRKTRSSEHVERFLTGFSGILVSDGFSGYHALDKRREDIRSANCWTHARRPFADAVKIAKQKGGPSKQAIKKSLAHQALERIGVLFSLEDEWKDLMPEERRNRRQEQALPLVEAYFAWIKSINPDTVISEKVRTGLQYSINQEKYLRAYLEDGNVPIDNSASERAIRPFCVGRANWHIIDSINGAEASAAVYSLVETAKANHLKPYEYLRYLLTEMPKHMEDTDYSFLDQLLPWADTIPDICKKDTPNES